MDEGDCQTGSRIRSGQNVYNVHKVVRIEAESFGNSSSTGARTASPIASESSAQRSRLFATSPVHFIDLALSAVLVQFQRSSSAVLAQFWKLCEAVHTVHTVHSRTQSVLARFDVISPPLSKQAAP